MTCSILMDAINHPNVAGQMDSLASLRILRYTVRQLRADSEDCDE